MNISTDFMDIVEDLLIVILSVIFIYLLHYNFFRNTEKQGKSGEPTEQKLFEVDMQEEDLNEQKKEIQKSIEDKKKEYLQGKIELGEYKRFIRKQHVELVALNSKLRK